MEKVYGLPPGMYDRIYEAQGRKCAICHRARGLKKKLSTDHDHETGLVRGLLCQGCNKLLGFARDDPAFFHRATIYLMRPPAQEFGEFMHEDGPRE